MAKELVFLFLLLLWHVLRVRGQRTDFSVVTGGLSTWNQSEWSLTTKGYIPGQFQARMTLANGYVGASLANSGPYFAKDINQTHPDLQVSNGWPTFGQRISLSTISGFYDVQPNASASNYPWLNQYGWESFISGIPYPTGIIFAFGDSYLDGSVGNTTMGLFQSKLTFKTGVGEYNYTWYPTNDTSCDVSHQVFYHRARPNVIVVQTSITPSTDINGTVTDLFDGQSAVRTDLAAKGLDENATTMYASVHPNGLPNVTAWLVSGVNFSNPYTNLSSRAVAQGPHVSTNESTIGQTFDINLIAGETATFQKFVGVASTDKFVDAEAVARREQALAQSDGYEVLYAEHVAEWAGILTPDSVDDFTDPVTGELPDDPIIEILQVLSVANPYYLLQNLQPDGSDLNDNSISVGGLGSESYGGLIFWDADYWMAPALNLAFQTGQSRSVIFASSSTPRLSEMQLSTATQMEVRCIRGQPGDMAIVLLLDLVPTTSII